jgi:hypothetical protein
MEKLLDGAKTELKVLDEISIKISSGGTPRTGVSEYYDGDILSNINHFAGVFSLYIATD